MKDKMRELLPCPFCDSNAALEHHHYFSIECSNEECGVILSNISQVKLIKAWNTRANQAELARLRALLECKIKPRLLAWKSRPKTIGTWAEISAVYQDIEQALSNPGVK